MIRRLSLWLLLSLGIHAVLVAVTLALVTLAPLPLPMPMLFVDLVHGLFGATDSAPAAGGRGGGPAPGGPRAAAPATPSLPPRPAPDNGASGSQALPEAIARAPEAVAAPEPRPRFEPEPVRPAAETSTPVAPGRVAEIAPPSIPGGGRVDATSRVAGEGGAASGPARGGGGATAGSRTVDSGSASGGPGSAGDGAGLGLGAREGSVLALAIPGDGSGAGSEYDTYVALLRRRVQDSLAYPPAARRRELRGTVQLDVDVQPTGAITHVALAVSSSHRVLDEAALEAARGVDRVPFPPNLRPRPLRVRLPVVFVPY